MEIPGFIDHIFLRFGSHSLYSSIGNNLPGQPELAVDSFDHLFVGGYLRLDQFERHFLIELLVQDPIDLPHSAVAQFFDDLVATAKGRAGGQLMNGRLKGFSGRVGDIL